MYNYRKSVKIMFERHYEIKKGPNGLSLEEYKSIVYEEFKTLLNDYSGEEKIFQSFFEENPLCMPGAFELIGASGHYPHNSALISHPKLGDLDMLRIPDFMWLAQDSSEFCPVLIEIEKPNKKLYNGSGQQTAEFSQAYGQIQEWKALLNKPNVIMDFYDYYEIPISLRNKNFNPQYCLIYGRRSEFENNEALNRKRSQLTNDDIILMSYDRVLDLIQKCQGEFVTCNVVKKRYKVIHISPTYKYRPGLVGDLSKLDCFTECIDNIKYISDERKRFLKERYSYWLDFGSSESKGIINTSDAE